MKLKKVSDKSNYVAYFLVFLIVFSFSSIAVYGAPISDAGISALNSIKSAEDIMREMQGKGFNVASINDTIEEALQLYQLQVQLENKNLTANYEFILKKIDYVSQTYDKAFTAKDELDILEKRINSTKGLNITDVIETYNSAKKEFYDERYDNSLELVDKAYNQLSEKEALSTYGSAIYNAITGGVANFFKKNWKILIASFFVIILLLYFTNNKRKLFFLKKKISRLSSEKQVLLEMIKNAQLDYFEKKIIPEMTYHIKLKKFSELIRDIDRQVPLLVEDTLKLQKGALEQIKSAKDIKVGKSSVIEIEARKPGLPEIKPEIKEKEAKKKSFFQRWRIAYLKNKEKKQKEAEEKRRLKQKSSEERKTRLERKRLEEQRKRNAQRRLEEQKRAEAERKRAEQRRLEEKEKTRNLKAEKEKQLQKRIEELGGKRRKSIFQRIRFAYLKGKERRIHKKNKRRLENQRKIDEQKKIEEQKRADEERKKAEQRRLEEQKRIEKQKIKEAQIRKREELINQRELEKKAEERKKAEAKKQEEQRRINEQKRAEEERRLKKQKKIDEKRKRAEARSLEEQKRKLERQRAIEGRKREKEERIQQRLRLKEAKRAEKSRRKAEKQRLKQQKKKQKEMLREARRAEAERKREARNKEKEARKLGAKRKREAKNREKEEQRKKEEQKKLERQKAEKQRRIDEQMLDEREKGQLHSSANRKIRKLQIIAQQKKMTGEEGRGITKGLFDFLLKNNQAKNKNKKKAKQTIKKRKEYKSRKNKQERKKKS